MELNLSLSVRIAVFVAGSVFLTVLSRRALRNPASHGFYRYFAFEAILLLLMLNVPFWFRDPASPAQLFSWLLLFSSLYLVAHGTTLLVKRGGSDPRQDSPENLAFENTATLVTGGIYKYIRHPMYASLLYLAWGLYLKQVNLPATVLVLLATAALMLAVRMEERENLAFFGAAYAEYMHKSRRFIPFIF